jgi:hypothetical protein
MGWKKGLVALSALLALMGVSQTALADNVVTYVTGVSTGSGGAGQYDSATGKYYKLSLVSENNPNTGDTTPQFKQYDLLSSADGLTYTYDRTLVDEADVTLLYEDFDNYNNSVSSDWSVDKGTWQVVLDGTNTYKQTGAGNGVVSRIGGSGWTDYAASADVKRLGDGAALLGRYQDDSNYYQLMLSSTDWTLNKLVGGTWTTLDSGAFATSTSTYYNVKLVFAGTNIQAYIDGTKVSEVTDSSLASGTVGLRSTNGQAYFDNVRAVQHMLLDDFASGTGQWTVDKGTWTTYTETYASGNPDNTVYEQSGSGSGIVFAGSAAWTDYTVSTYVKRVGTGAGILGRVQDDQNFYQLIISSGSWTLNKFVGGVWSTLETGNHTFSNTNYYHLQMIFSGSTIKVGIWDENGNPIVDSPNSDTPVTATDTSFASGKIGLRANTGHAFFDNVAVGGLMTDALYRSQHWIKSPVTGHWSIWTKRQYGTSGADGAAQNLLALTSMDGKINGQYMMVYAGYPDGNRSGDLGLFTDDDPAHSRYIVSADTPNGYVNIYKLNADNDYFDLSASQAGHTDGLINHIDCSTAGINCYSVNGKHNVEAPSLLKFNGYYYIFGSGVSGWRPNQQQYTYASSLGGTWADAQKIGDSSGYHSQLFSVAQIFGSAQHSFLFTSTRNGALWGGKSTQVYLPMYVNNPGSTPSADFRFSTNYYDYMEANYTTGEVKGYNYDVGTKLAVSGVTAAYDDGTNTPGKTIDGNDSTYWINNNTKASGVITYDLGSTHTVKAVKLRLDDNDHKRVNHIKIEVGNGTTYTTIYDVDANDVGGVTAAIDWLQPIPLQDRTQSGRYVKISLTGANSEGANNYGFKIYEAQIWGDPANTAASVDETFASGTPGSAPAGWTVTADAGTSATVEVDGGDNRLKLNDGSSSGKVTAAKSFTRQEGSTVTASLDFKVSAVGSGETLALKSGSVEAIKITNAANGLVFSDSLGANQLIAPITTGTWYRLKIEANTDADTFDVYLSTPGDADFDDNLVRGGGRMDLLSNDIPSFGSLEFATSVSGTGQLWVDNIKVNGPLF